jgi:hypothetical protein
MFEYVSMFSSLCANRSPWEEKPSTPRALTTAHAARVCIPCSRPGLCNATRNGIHATPALNGCTAGLPSAAVRGCTAVLWRCRAQQRRNRSAAPLHPARFRRARRCVRSGGPLTCRSLWALLATAAAARAPVRVREQERLEDRLRFVIPDSASSPESLRRQPVCRCTKSAARLPDAALKCSCRAAGRAAGGASPSERRCGMRK